MSGTLEDCEQSNSSQCDKPPMPDPFLSWACISTEDFNEPENSRNSIISFSSILEDVLSSNDNHNVKGPPDQTPMSGPYNFSVELYAPSNKCLYSEALGRIYVERGVDIPFQFSWSGRGERTALVRASVVFADQPAARVVSCVQHRPLALPASMANNVLHSSRSEDVTYCGREDKPDEWYSVLVQFPPEKRERSKEEGDRNKRVHMYRFICSNSCTTGINRRKIKIVFNLEDGIGTVYGRQPISVQVCNNPQRELLKDKFHEHLPRSRSTAYWQSRHQQLPIMRSLDFHDWRARREMRLRDRQIELDPHTECSHSSYTPLREVQTSTINCVRDREDLCSDKPNGDAGTTDLEIHYLPKLAVVGSAALVGGLEVMARMMQQAAALRPAARAPAERAVAAIRAYIDAFHGDEPSRTDK